MNDSVASEDRIAGRVLTIGCGGLGSPALKVLAQSGVRDFVLLDDDIVDVSNLHRQTLYQDADLGRPKIEVAAETLRGLCDDEAGMRVETHQSRFTPATAEALLQCAPSVVLEGADNFATKFLAADAAHLAGRSIVQAGAVRWNGWALAQRPGETACLRCVFEDIPRGQPETCAVAGVVGPVVGVLGAIAAALTLALLLGDARAAGVLFSYDGLEGRLRRIPVSRRKDCPLCRGDIKDLEISRYVTAA